MRNSKLLHAPLPSILLSLNTVRETLLLAISDRFHFWFLIGGKRDEKLILPSNSSISVTLSQDQVS